MITARRSLRARHEFRFGTREIVALAVGSCLVSGVVFAAGLLIGREMGRGAAPSARASAPAAPASAHAEAASPDVAGAPPGEDRLTFYKTLTAPTLELPAPVPPRVEERLVPEEEPAPPAARPAREAAPPAPPRRLAPPRSGRPPAVRPPERLARAPAPARPAPPAASPAPAHPDGWTVQVSSFRSRTLADDLRARLAARGLEAYILTTATEEGQVRHRVRVGAYAQRGDAERVAAELRTERGLNPIVTARTR
jgi:cell division septation protein DedD